MMQQTVATTCERCGHPLQHGQLICPNCGNPVYQHQLEPIVAEAVRLEQINPAAATMVWRQALDLLPPGSEPYQQIQSRVGALASGWSPATPPVPPPLPGAWPAGAQEIPRPEPQNRPVRPPDPLPVALLKTLGSMAVSIIVYYFAAFGNLPVAIGFVVLMLIHEMGHVLATRYYGLSASPPIFIPFVGAVINLRQSPPNALVESVVGIGGPFLGTIGALGCYGLSFATHGTLRAELQIVAYLGVFLNLINLLPVPPLDGGRVTAAISPWLWIAGLVGLGVLMFYEAKNVGVFGLIIPVLILLYALPRIRATLQARG